MTGTAREPQLSLEVSPHPNVVERDAEGIATYMTGTMMVTGEFDVKRDFNAGDRFTVTIADEDGQIISSAVAECNEVPGDQGEARRRDRDQPAARRRAGRRMSPAEALALQRVVEERAQAELALRSAASPERLAETATTYVSACSEHAKLTYGIAQRMGLEP